jgi:PAS domain S-box-containing protein
MNLKFPMESIRYKFFSAIAMVLLAGTVALSVIIAVNERIDKQDQLTKKGRGLAQYVAKLCLDPLIMNDTIQLDSIVNEARYDDDILYTVIIDKKGEVRTSQFSSINYSSPRVATLKEKLHDLKEIDKILEFIKSNESSIEVTAPVITGNETIGKVVVCLSSHKIISNILNTVAFIVSLNIVVVIILGMILFTVSRRIIFDPVSALARASRQLAKGDLATRLNATAIGEMQQLFDSFNQMAENLQQTTVSKNYVNNIIKSMSEALLIVSPDYTVLDVNDAAYSLLGYEQGELSGIRVEALFDESLFLLVSSGAGGRRISLESLCKRKDGRTIPIYFTASAMLDGDGAMLGFVCTALDISAMKKVTEQLAVTNCALQLEVEQRKNAQEEASWLNTDLERQKSALELANRELESFCYSVSHDLRAPLRHINGFTTILNEDYRQCLDDLGCDCLDRVCAASSHMGTLIDDLLRFSRVSRAEMKVVDLDLSARAQRIAIMFRESEPGRNTQVEVAEGLTARGDASLMDMVLQNLIGNAWKYSSGTPGALISVGRIHVPGQAEEAFYVKDNGVGFDMAYKDKLFRVFERLHGEEFEGTGIGLATVQRIIERHGGTVWAEGEVGKGATFFFTLSGHSDQ